MTKKLRVAVMDDHALFREGFVALLSREPDLEVVGAARDVPEIVGLCQRARPDVVFLDVSAPPDGGIEALRRIKAEHSEIRGVMLTVSERDDHFVSALEAGASGYLLKSVEFDDLLRAVRLVATGQVAIAPEMAAKLVSSYRSAPPSTPAPARDTSRLLSDREREVLAHVAHGKTNKEIARALLISEHTVRAHLRSIMDKLHLDNRVQAAAFVSREASAEVYLA